MPPARTKPVDPPAEPDTQAEQQPEPEQVITSDHLDEAYRKGFADGHAKGHKDGYQEGLASSRPRKPLFEHARDVALRNYQLNRDGALDTDALWQLLDEVQAEFGERLIDSDRQLIRENVQREVVVHRARTTTDAKPRTLKPSERSQTAPKATEYEVVR